MSKKNFAKGIDAILGRNEEDRISSAENVSKENPKERVLRTSLYIDVEKSEKLKAIAYWERRSFTSIVNEAFSLYIESKGKKYTDDATKKYLESLNK